ncbi:MAG: tetratricopeptide repeat protein [Candidatus Nitrotoga sp.]
MKLLINLFVIAIALLIPSAVSAVDNELFNDLISKIRFKDYAQVEKFLESNKPSLASYPEYYVLLLNYVISKGDKTGIVVAKGTPNGDDLSLTSKESGEVVGFLGTRGGYDEELIVNGITDTQKALKSFNSRLDIHFGIVSVAARIERLDIVGNQLKKILEDSIKLDNKWIWGPINSMDGDPKEFMIQNVVSNTSLLFRANTKQADEALTSVSETLVKLYPNEIYGYANLGTLCLAQKEYDCAEQYYNHALKLF